MLRVVTRIDHFAGGSQSSVGLEPIDDSPDNLTDRDEPASFAAWRDEVRTPAPIDPVDYCGIAYFADEFGASPSPRADIPADETTTHHPIGGDSSFDLHNGCFRR